MKREVWSVDATLLTDDMKLYVDGFIPWTPDTCLGDKFRFPHVCDPRSGELLEARLIEMRTRFNQILYRVKPERIFSWSDKVEAPKFSTDPPSQKEINAQRSN